MIDVEDQNRFWVNSPEFLDNPLFPAFGKVALRLQILSEKAVLMGHSHEIEDGGDHVQVRNQDRLGQISSEVLVVLAESYPKTGDSFAQHVGVHFVQMRPYFEAFVNLVRFQLADGDAADELPEGIRAEAEVDFRKLHGFDVNPPAYHGVLCLKPAGRSGRLRYNKAACPKCEM